MRNEKIFSLSGIFPRMQVYDATILTGRVLDLNLGLIMLAAGKDAVQSLSGVPFGSLIPYHRVLGWIYVFIAILHTIAYIWTLGLDPVESFGDHMSYLARVIRAQSMGFYGTLIAVPAVIAAIPWMRRRHYNLFSYSHSLLYGPSFVLLCFHVTSVFYYSLPGLLFQVIDRFVRLYACQYPLPVVNARLVGPRFVIIEIDTSSRPEFAIGKSGQYVRILVKQVSNLEWHTFSIFNTRRDPKTGKTLTSLFIDTKGDWCLGLKRYLRTTSISFQPEVAVCGPYGHEFLDSELEEEDIILCVAAGSGVAPCHSLARKHPSAKMYWTFRENDASDKANVVVFRGLNIVYHKTGTKKVDLKGFGFHEDSIKSQRAAIEKFERSKSHAKVEVPVRTAPIPKVINGVDCLKNSKPKAHNASIRKGHTSAGDFTVMIPADEKKANAPLALGIPTLQEHDDDLDSAYEQSPTRETEMFPSSKTDISAKTRIDIRKILDDSLLESSATFVYPNRLKVTVYMCGPPQFLIKYLRRLKFCASAKTVPKYNSEHGEIFGLQ